MPEIELYEILVIGSGEAGKWLTWTMAQVGHGTAVVDAEIYRRIVSKHRVLAQQERDS